MPREAFLQLLTSLAEQPDEPLQAVAEWISRATGATAVGIIEVAGRDIALLATSGTAAEWPIDIAADSIDAEDAVNRNDWTAVPIESSGAPTRGLLIRSGNISPDIVEIVARAVALASLWSRTCLLRRQSDALLEAIAQWSRTEDLPTLFEQMAEASTNLFACDRATIFLWDQPANSLVGRPALGLPGGELRIPDDVGIVGQVVATGQPARINRGDDRADIFAGVDEQTGYKTESLLCVPIRSHDGNLLGVFELINKHSGRFTDADQIGLNELARHAASALTETQQWQQLLAYNEQLRDDFGSDEFIGNCPSIESLRKTLRSVADTDLAVLLLGENGTGKEVAARLLHTASKRSKAPFLAVNCAAITETLLESELFGHEKGAFTDAHATRIGKFEAAAGGTLLLDEIGDMSLAGQAKLLRVLEEKVIVRVGGTAAISTDVRVVAATNKNLAQLVSEKRFREDLYYRLNVVSLEVPPLRDRGDDILKLAQHFLAEFCKRQGKKTSKLTATARKQLLAHRWPGNVREMRNLMERLAYLSEGDRIDADELSFVLSPSSRDDWFRGDEPLAEATRQFQMEYIERTVSRLGGNVTEAAKALGLHRSNLYRKMKQLDMPMQDQEEHRE